MYARSFSERTAELKETTPAVQTGIRVERLVLTHFRNYAFAELNIPETARHVVLYGQNGCGKTNLLESVSFLTAGRGLRGARLTDAAQRAETSETTANRSDWAVSGVLKRGGELLKIGTGRTAQDSVFDKRHIRVNGEECKNQANLAALIPMVWLTPSMDRLFCAEPSARRRFVDRLAQCFDAAHAGHCAAYANALKQYNRLLKDGTCDADWIRALETTLCKYGALITQTRARTLTLIAAELAQSVPEFVRAQISFDSAVTQEDLHTAFETARHSGEFISNAPHTADLKAFDADKNMPAALCSTGEQKALLISILLAHLKALARHTGTLPLLLLDEAGAHLDAARRDAFFDYLNTLNTQTWVTGTDKRSFDVLAANACFCAVEDLSDDPNRVNAAAS